MKAVTFVRVLYRRFVQNDPDAGLHLLRKVGKILLPNYRFCWPQVGWWENERFTAYLQRFGEIDGMNSDRYWMAYQLCRLTRDVPGDTVECGVYRGATSYLICVANRSLGREHHVFDSFEGLSKPGQRDGTHWKEGDLAAPETEVEKNLSEFSGVHLYKGWIPDRFPEVGSRTFSFVHVDVDLEQPTLASVEFFYPRLSPGGILLCDDYGFTTCPGATAALDEFFADRPEKMIALGGGSGFIVKGSTVGPPFEANA